MNRLTALNAALLLALTLSACGTVQHALEPPNQTATADYNPYTSGMGPCPQWIPGDGVGGCRSEIAPPNRQAGGVAAKP
jgi:hypothetical protein